MTVVAGLQHGRSVWLATDSFMGDEESDETVERFPGAKIFSRGPLTFAFAGSIRAAQIVEHHAEFRAPRDSDELFAYIVREIVPAVRRAYATHWDAPKLPTTDYLVALRGRLFTLCEDMCVVPATREQPYTALGFAKRYAIGALAATPDLPPRVRLERAIEAAAQHSVGARLPAHVVRVAA